MSDDLLKRAQRQVQGIEDPSTREQLIIGLIAEVESLRATCADFILMINDRCAERDSARAEVERLRKEAECLRMDLESTRSRLDDATSEADKLRDRVIYYRDSEITSLRAEVRRLRPLGGLET